MAKTLTDRASFERWLSSNNAFQDGYVSMISPLPGATSQLATTLEFSHQVEGSLVAGNIRRMRRSTLRCMGLRRFEFEWGEFASGYCLEGVETLDDSTAPIAFAVNVPGRLVVVASRAEVVEQSDLVEVVPAWESEYEAFLTLTNDLPAPTDIVDRCAARTGVRLAWRILGGAGRSPAEVPLAYDGWFLQRADRIACTEGGIMMRIGRSTEGFHTVFLDTMSSAFDPVLWASVLATFASLGVARSSCGNREMDAVGFSDLAARKIREAGLQPTASPCAAPSSREAEGGPT